jgi:hypothetical protein
MAVGPHSFVALHAPVNKIAERADRVTVSALEHVFSAKNALYEALEAAIGG